MSIMTSRQASELDFALERNGWTAEDVKKASGGDLLARLLLVVRDQAEVVMRKILTFVHKVRIDAQPSVTTSRSYFKEAGVSWMSPSFRAQFLGLEILSTEEVELSVHKLEVKSVHSSIIEELGGKEKAEISVSQFKAFLADNRESSGWFIAYLRDGDGKLWAVNAYRSVFAYGWSIEACLVDGPHKWDPHNRYVLSH